MSARITEALRRIAALRYAEDADVYDTLDEALSIADAALSTEPGEAEGWRDMSSAPRDGTKFLAFEKGRYFDCWWEDKGYGESYWMDEADSEPNPSAWRILPAAPLPEDTHHGR